MRLRKIAVSAVAMSLASALLVAGCSNGAPATGSGAGSNAAARSGGGQITVALVTHAAPEFASTAATSHREVNSASP